MSSPLPPSPARVALAGAGSVGTLVAHALQAKGHSLAGVWSRRPESAATASRRLGCGIFESAAAAARAADVVLIGASDDAIGDVAESVSLGVNEGAVAVHFSGAVGVDVLTPVMAAGGRAAALHPVQALPDFDMGRARLPGSAWGVTCSEGLEEWARWLVRDDLGGRPVLVAEADRPLWHAAAVMTSNGIAALMGSGMATLEAIGVSDPQTVLGPLASGTVANVRAADEVAAAFTGPVLRGDKSTITRHVHALERVPELLREYRLAVEIVIAGAVRTGRIGPTEEAEMRALVEGT